MSGIDPVGGQPPVRPGARRTGGQVESGFRPPAEPGADQARSAGGVAPPVALESLLALQQVDDAPAQDRAAHRRGQALLAALGRLQRSLLGPADPAATLAEIRTLAEDVPAAADPGLAAVVDQVVLRARIELARREAG